MTEAIKQPASPPKDVLWVSALDGGHIQVSHIVRFAQQDETTVQVWTSDGKISRSSDPAFFPPTVVHYNEPVASGGASVDAGGGG